MPLQTRPIAIKLAVAAFFLVAIIAQYKGISSFTSCKRALMAAVIAYVMTAVCIKVVNIILVNAMINRELDKQKDIGSDN